MSTWKTILFTRRREFLNHLDCMELSCYRYFMLVPKTGINYYNNFDRFTETYIFEVHNETNLTNQTTRSDKEKHPKS